MFTGALVWATPSALRLRVWVDVFSTVFTGAGGPLSSSISLPRIPACQRKLSCNRAVARASVSGVPGVCWGTNRGDRRGSRGEIKSALHSTSTHKVAKQLGPAIAPGANRPNEANEANEAEAMSERLCAGRRRGVRRGPELGISTRHTLVATDILSPFFIALQGVVGGGAKRLERGEEPRMRVVRVGGCASFSAAIDHDGVSQLVVVSTAKTFGRL